MTSLAPKRRNPAWLTAIARWIGKQRRARQLRQQNFSKNAIRGLLG